LVLLVLTMLLCSWLGYELPNPPIEEEGMGVAGEVLGEIEGFGNNDNATFNDNSAAAPAASAPDESYTTGEEPAPVAKAPKKEDKPVPTKKPEQSTTQSESNAPATSEATQPTTNSNATFKGRKNGTGSEGKGTATGSGQEGSPDGAVGAQGGSGNSNGIGWSLYGRGLRGSLQKPTYDSKKDGDVVVSIKVNKNGDVVEVDAPKRGSKNYDDTMVAAAKEAAKKAKFTVSNDDNAPEYQYGTITYKFRRQG